MFHPIATYRIQFHKDFPFSKLKEALPYLQQLGVRTVYASPIFTAVPGSNHGYDGLDPLSVNPEVGTEEELKELSARLSEAGMGWLQDIVPNHMAFDPRNEWLMDVLEKGLQSRYARFFDIAWTSALYHGRVMVPFLGATLEEAIEKGEIQLATDGQRLTLKYYDSAWPLSPRSYGTLLAEIPDPSQAVQQLLENLHPVRQAEDPELYSQSWEEWRLQFASLLKNEDFRRAFTATLDRLNGDKAFVQQIADAQEYRLCHWQETDRQINYRRFFTVNGLICMNMQDREVFEHYHRFIAHGVQEGWFQGLRVDHIDGLYDPAAYLEQLRDLAGEDSYLVVEKILEPGERLPDDWPIQGNTGYDFLSDVNNLFTWPGGEKPFSRLYHSLVRNHQTVEQQVHIKKAHILHEHMAGELDNLYKLFLELNLVPGRALASIHPDDLKSAIGEMLIHCPVYRYYGNRFPLAAEEQEALRKLFGELRRTNAARNSCIALLEQVLLHNPGSDEGYNARVAQFYQRCMQFSGPLMAKGVEDTLMYTYHRHIGHNEVGDAPDAFGFSPEVFHQKMTERQQRWPASLNATATHDTKRGEDARARLQVLSSLPDEWTAEVRAWMELNKPLKTAGAPDANDEYFLYQSLVATWPLEEPERAGYGDRLEAYLQKAVREAKVHSNWTTPNEGYESGFKAFARALLQPEGAFFPRFTAFLDRIKDLSVAQSLAQVVLKFTCPGTPDVYQGCELWDYSFVDPDNRRPVDYAARAAMLQAIGEQEGAALPEWLWENRDSGQIKLWTVQQLLRLRTQYATLFEQGEYVPLKVEGKHAAHVLAFARQYRQQLLIVAVPLHAARLAAGGDPRTIDWEDTRILLPPNSTGELEVPLLQGTLPSDKSLSVQELFAHYPFALLKGRIVSNQRGAGILMHITSLPSPYGVGDLGPEARDFADFLRHSRQKYWQLLPLNPTEGGQGYSPYSALSSRAGYPLLISPELLVQEGLLSLQDLEAAQQAPEARVDYPAAEAVKESLLRKAYTAYCAGKGSRLQPYFVQFNETEKEWLDDFALYSVLKTKHGGQPWYAWPDEYRMRQRRALSRLAKEAEDDITRIKWYQFLFFHQWKGLKDYCNERNISLIGDMPLYVSYDSSDVWANPSIFALDEAGARTGMAGVPPDAFSADGQLWGMPVFRWEVLKEQNYDWWIRRLRKNMELFDLVRLDHFRAFADYWEVPAGEETARNGSWKPGPGADFFEVAERELGDLPFVAEDLGDINDAVLQLRDRFSLPGMKVLQFAFGEDISRSAHIPHGHEPNFLVYTGTHDNNTVRGWFRQEADGGTRHRIERYTGQPVSEENVHQVLGRMAYASVARIAILPVQDVLALDESARMNVPASGTDNWAWRLLPDQLGHGAAEQLRGWTELYGRS
ncbi:MAG TPA: malto-oligosyltrehalose synthase [Chitinophagaceae bacterium]|jgi:malto-oligosyltrehalose synthase/4-alpha-glucanotransferase|nr:malto-oligosyltrehalose synthase [Chitinophagaceae bacterium]